MSVQSVVLSLRRVLGHWVSSLTDWEQLVSLIDGSEFGERLLLLNRVVLFQFSAGQTLVVDGSMGHPRRSRQQGTRRLRTAPGKIVMDDRKDQSTEVFLLIERLIAGVLVEHECPALKRRG